jgi:hypothetical protein
MTDQPGSPDAGTELGHPAACVYCGASGKLTKDHVPPKCLFPTPRPTDLITVSACEKCNGSFSADDEYFRIAVAAPATEHPQGGRVWDDGVVGRTLKKRPKLREALVRDLVRVELVTNAGLYVGTTTALSMSRPRIHGVVHRIVRGLLWHHYKLLLPPNTAALQTWDNPDVRPLLPMLRVDTILTGVGGEVFRYRHGVTVESPLVSLWWTCFYARTHFLTIADATADGVVIPRA